MCGIAGFTHKAWNPGSTRIEEAVRSLRHRGPDSHGVFKNRFVSLGAARLKIIDVASGDQPISTDDGLFTIAYNGEIYNHAELRSRLEGLGHRFHSHTDTEVFLRAFVQWDVDCFRMLRGMFAAAIWSEAERRLILVRDRLGIKPLYVALKDGDVYFGSELKTLFVHPEIERTLDPAALDCYLSLNYVPGPSTFIQGIEKLAPGEWLEWHDGRVCREPYWTLPDPQPRELSLEQAKEQLDELLVSSVREHMISDVPLGLWLSGGLDSSTILHYAARESSRPINTFSVTFRGRSFDESSYLKPLVSHYGTHHEELDLNPELNLVQAIEEFAQFADEPNADAGALPVWFLSKLTRRTATVALSGEGADELLGGYLTYRADALARTMRRLPAPLLRLFRAGAHALPPSDEKIGLEYKLKRFFEGSLMPFEHAHVYWNGTFSASEKRSLTARHLPSALAEKLAELRSRGDNLSAWLWFDQKYYLPDDILSKVDRMSMAHSVEVRPPFLDHRLAEFAAILPDRFKLEGSNQKVVLRELMRGRLPAATLRRGKTGFDIPAHEWLRGPLRPLLLDTLEWGASEHNELFRSNKLQTYVDAHLQRRANYGYHLWGLMILFLWMKKWKVQTAPTVTLQPALAAVSS